MTAKTNHITEDLVEQLAIIGYEQTRIQNGDLPMPSWTGAGAMTRFTAKSQALAVLKMMVPVLIELGWKPPTVAQPELKANSKPDQDFEGVGTVANSLDWSVDKLRAHFEWGGQLHNDPAEFDGMLDRVRAEAKAEGMREAIKSVRWVYNLQCPVKPADNYIHRAAQIAHKWWEKVLGGRLDELERRANQYKEEQ